jgi:hypothetical protein
MKTYAVIVRHNPSDTRLFARIIRKQEGDVVVAWSIDEPKTPNRVPSWNPQSTYHKDGRQHAKSYNRPNVIKHGQRPDPAFKGCVQLIATNADRMRSPLRSCFPTDFDDVLEVPIHMVSGKQNQFVSVDLVEPGIEPLRQTGSDTVLLEAIFKDDVPWIVVTFGETSL